MPDDAANQNPANNQSGAPNTPAVNPLDPAAIPAPPIGTPPVDLPGAAPVVPPVPAGSMAPAPEATPNIPPVQPSADDLSAAAAAVTGAPKTDAPEQHFALGADASAPETLEEMVRDLDRTIVNAMLELIPAEQFAGHQAAVHGELGKAFASLSQIEGKGAGGEDKRQVDEARGKVAIFETIVNRLADK